MARLKPGDTAPLNVTQQARHRVFVGLGWEPAENGGLLGRASALLRGRSPHHDLDLSCYIYDRDGRYIGHVAAGEGRVADQTGRIYHSGDNIEGLGDGDDEQISAELKDLDPAIANIIFKASIKSGHSFAEVRDPEIHISDGYTGHTFLHQTLGDAPGNTAGAYIFIRLFRTPDGQWRMHNIATFMDNQPAEAWPDALKPFCRL
jgi:stress response protein SCP2